MGGVYRRGQDREMAVSWGCDPFIFSSHQEFQTCVDKLLQPKIKKIIAPHLLYVSNNPARVREPCICLYTQQSVIVNIV